MIRDVGFTMMKIERRDVFLSILLCLALMPLMMCAATGLMFLPRLIMHADPPTVIARIIRATSHSTGIGTVPLVYVVLVAPGIIAAILFAAFGGKEWMAHKTLDQHKRRSQHRSARDSSKAADGLT